MDTMIKALETALETTARALGEVGDMAITDAINGGLA